MRATCVAAVLGTVVIASSSSAQTLQLPGADRYPEGIAAGADGKLFVSSLTRGEILRISPATGAAEIFTKGNADLMSSLGLRVSHDGTRIYACSSDPSGLHGGRGSELVAFESATGEVVGRYLFPGGGLCNDLTELADGTILATDSFAPRILALTPAANTLVEWVRDARFEGEGFNLNGIAALGSRVYAVKYNNGELFAFTDWEKGTPTIVTVALDRPLAGPDGLIAYGDGLLVVEGNAGSLSRIALDPRTRSGVVSVIADGLDSPTTVAVVGVEAFVVQGQLDHFFGMDPSPPGPFLLARIPIE